MQTFVPYDDIYKSIEVLDRQRLGKQRVETFQLLNAIAGKTKGWVHHPAAIMWRENVNGLIAYGVAACDEWISRGYADSCRDKILAHGHADFTDLPTWWGDDRVHSSHRANLLRKMPDFYAQYGWVEDPSMPYFWPNQEEVNV